MNRWVTLLVLLAVILSAGVYLNNKQKDYSRKTEEAMSEQFETWAKTREALFRDTESKKQTMMLLGQQERTRNLEASLSSRLQDFKQQGDKLQQEAQDSISRQQAEYKNFTEDFTKEIDKRFEKDAQKRKEYEEQVQKSLQKKFQAQQDTIDNRIKELTQQYGAQQVEYARQFDVLLKRIGDLAKDIEDYRLQIKDFDWQLQDLKRRVDKLQ